jgi:hypothetical protein
MSFLVDKMQVKYDLQVSHVINSKRRLNYIGDGYIDILSNIQVVSVLNFAPQIFYRI